MASEALIFAGGEPVHPMWHKEIRERARSGALVIAADSGIEHLHALGLVAALLIGDLDSATTESIERARSEGTVIDEHSADKDETDLALALRAARTARVTHATVLGVGGGRTDHLFANALLLAQDTYADLIIDARFGPDLLTVVRARTTLTGAPGDLVTLLAVGGTARGVTTSGLRWQLNSEQLEPGSSRGVSNEMIAAEAVIQIESGVLLTIQPAPLESIR
ncbi:MAG: thiamine diphosphokinase [Acidimicrobiia bacterium]|nr:thiamine diphosphokinase [Acidimicrobiia bacterium]